MEISTERWTLSEPFFPKSGHFLWLSKKGRGGLTPPPCCCTPERWSIKKLFLKILQYSQKNTYAGGLGLTLYQKRLQHRCFPENIATSLRATFSQNNYVTASGRWIWKHFLVVTNLSFARRISKQKLWKAFFLIAIS